MFLTQQITFVPFSLRSFCFLGRNHMADNINLTFLLSQYVKFFLSFRYHSSYTTTINVRNWRAVKQFVLFQLLYKSANRRKDILQRDILQTDFFIRCFVKQWVTLLLVSSLSRLKPKTEQGTYFWSAEMKQCCLNATQQVTSILPLLDRSSRAVSHPPLIKSLISLEYNIPPLSKTSFKVFFHLKEEDFVNVILYFTSTKQNSFSLSSPSP